MRVRNFARIVAASGLLIAACIACTSCNENKKSESSSNSSNNSEDSLTSGMSAPDISLPDLSGTMHSLAEFKGKVVLLNFWATWCAPCVSEMPALEKLSETYRDKGLTIVAISVDPPNGRNTLERFISEHHLTFPVLLDPELNFLDNYGVTGFPETIFLDKGGNVMSVTDPETKTSTVRLLSDREWDKEPYTSLVRELLKRGLN